MCINTKYSMSIIEKVFKYGETELSVIKCKDDMWFRGKTLAEVSGYSIHLKLFACTSILRTKKKCRNWFIKGVLKMGTPLGMYREGLSTLTNLGYLLLSFVYS